MFRKKAINIEEYLKNINKKIEDGSANEVERDESRIITEYISIRDELRELSARKNSMLESKVRNFIAHIEKDGLKSISKLNIATLVLKEARNSLTKEHLDISTLQNMLNNYGYRDILGAIGVSLLLGLVLLICFIITGQDVFPLLIASLILLGVGYLLSAVFNEDFEFTARMTQLYVSCKHTYNLDKVLQKNHIEKNSDVYERLNDILIEIDINRFGSCSDYSDNYINEIAVILSAKTKDDIKKIDKIISKYNKKEERIYRDKLKNLKKAIVYSESFNENKNTASSNSSAFDNIYVTKYSYV